jgi:hypothetical protein
MAPVTTLRHGAFFVIKHFQASAYLTLIRTTLSFEREAQVVDEYSHCRKVLTGIELGRYGLLLDWRGPQMTTDANLHRVIVHHTDAFASAFARRAILVRTSVGQMQVARVSRAHSESAPTLFSDEEAAIAHVAWNAARELSVAAK